MKTKDFKIKQVLVLRTGIGMQKGKMVAQGAHAAINAILPIVCNYYDINDPKFQWKSWFYQWMNDGYKKAAVKFNGSDDEFHQLYLKAKEKNIPCSYIVDLGLTQIKPNTPTAIAIGPAPDEFFEGLTDQLKLL